MIGYVLRVLLVLLLVAAPARADQDNESRARDLYQRGMAHFQLDEFEVAIQLWLQAYRLQPAPELLYDLAQAYRFSSARSLSFYKKFLEIHPNAPNRAEVERQIAVLTRQINDQQNTVAAPLPPEVKRPAWTVAAASPPPAPAPSVLFTRPPDRPLVKTKKGGLWVGLVLGAAAVAVGVGVGVTYGVKQGDPNPNFGTARGN